MDASYAYPDTHSWLQKQSVCFICGSHDSLLPKKDLKVQLDLTSAKFKEINELNIQSSSVRASFESTYKPSEITSLTFHLNNIQKELKRNQEEDKKDKLLIQQLDTENSRVKNLLSQAKASKSEKTEEIRIKSNILSDLRHRLKEMSNILFVERMKKAVHLFRLMAIIVTIPNAYKSTSGKNVKDDRISPNRALQLTGCSSIMSIPLPNNGLFSDLPFESTAIALSHIAHLVDALSTVLNIPLAHPIIQVNATSSLISPQYNLTACYALSPVIHINDRAQHHQFTWLSPTELKKNIKLNKNMDSIADLIINKAFTQALTLLQANIISLCLHAGIPPDCIWPPQAMLLNLHELFVLCAKCVKRNSAPPSQQILSAGSTAGTTVDLPVNSNSANIDRKKILIPTVYQGNGANDTVKSLTKRYSQPGTNSKVSLDLPTAIENDNDEITFVSVTPPQEHKPHHEEEVHSEAYRRMAASIVAVNRINHDPYSNERYAEEYRESEGRAEDEYEILDMLLESQLLTRKRFNSNTSEDIWS